MDLGSTQTFRPYHQPIPLTISRPKIGKKKSGDRRHCYILRKTFNISQWGKNFLDHDKGHFKRENLKAKLQNAFHKKDTEFFLNNKLDNIKIHTNMYMSSIFDMLLLEYKLFQ